MYVPSPLPSCWCQEAPGSDVLMQPLACGDQWPRAGFPALLPLCGHARSQAPTC